MTIATLSTVWPMVPLGEVLFERQETPSNDALVRGEIPIVAKIGFNDGRIQLRTNSETKTGMILIRPGDFVISGINAAKGAVAVYGEENRKTIAATIHYSSYAPNKEQVDVKFLWWLLRSRLFRELLVEYVPGGIKTELKAKRFLPIPIPLPPLNEQLRIMARIEELASKVEKIRELRQKSVEQANALVSSLHLSLAAKRVVRIEDFLILDEDKVEVQFGKIYPQVGVKGFGQGLFEREVLDASQTTYKLFNRLYEDCIVLSQVKGWEGAIATCPSELAGFYASPEYRTFRCKAEEALPEYLTMLISTPWFYTKLKNLTRGVGGRRERIRPEKFLRMELQMPTLTQQKWAISAIRKLKHMKALQLETTSELDALLPAILDKAFKGEL